MAKTKLQKRSPTNVWWLNKALAAWIGIAAALASLATVVANIETIKKFVWRESPLPKLELQISDIYVGKTQKELFFRVAFTLTKNKEAVGKNCQAYLDVPDTYGYLVGDKFELYYGFESGRRDYRVMMSLTPKVGGRIGMIWVQCDAAVSQRVSVDLP
jgi:hypothetical protein